MTVNFVTVTVSELEDFVHRAFSAMGLYKEEADMCTAALIQSELYCHPGQCQGVTRLTGYHQRIVNGWVKPGAAFEILKDSPALALINGHNGLGSVIAQKAMALAVSKSKNVGVGTVIVRGSTHFGSAGVHTLHAVKQNCIGIAMTNAGPEMAPWGGSTPVLGTNPWSVAAPTGMGFPLMLDIALTTSGKGMMRWMLREGRTMPTDWALTPEGYETDDPAEAMQGALLGIGNHKGYGLSLITDVLTGVISGGAFGLTPYSDNSKLDVAHTFVAIDIQWFMLVEEFKNRMNCFIQEIKSSRLRPGFNEILIPGEMEHRRELKYKESGIPLDSQTFDSLNDLAKKLKIGLLRA